MTADMVSLIATYTDTNGLISGERFPRQSSGNALLFTAELLYVLRDYDFDDESYLEAIKKCRLAPGLYARTPKGCSFSMDQEGPDDYFGLGIISHYYNRFIAQDILYFGQTVKFFPFSSWWNFWVHFRYYYRTNPSSLADAWAPWFGRFPALLAHLKWATRIHTPNLFEALWWWVSVAFCGTDEDGWILSYLMLGVHSEGWLARSAAWVRMQRFKQSFWQGSMKRVFISYFNDTNHPIAKYCED